MKSAAAPNILNLTKNLIALVGIVVGVFVLVKASAFLSVRGGCVTLWKKCYSMNHVNTLDQGANKLCPSNTGMDDHLRKEFVLQHNDRRWRKPKYNGTELPYAAYMMALKYDCELEELALHFADDMCSGSLWTRELPEAGLNWLVTDKVYGKMHALKKAFRSWWGEYPLHGGIRKDLIFNEGAIPKGIRNFTQMIWANTTKIGCAVKQCSTFYSVACLYAPRGNQVGDAIYSPGGTCSKCPSGTRCVKKCTWDREARCGLCYEV